MEIEPEEYIRTKEGKIAKVLEFKKSEEEILNPYELHLNCSNFGICYTKEEIESIKHSKNIKELVKARRYNRMAKRRWLLLWNK